MLSTPAIFFQGARQGLLGPTLDQGEVDGCNSIMGALEGLPASWVAYALATAYHETAHSMQPVKEMGGDRYLFRMYDKAGQRPKVAAALGNTQPGDGIKFCGRGYVQITGRKNYAHIGTCIGVPLEQDPDLALQAPIAARIMRFGMETGAFTGWTFKSFLPQTGPIPHDAFRSARAIINGSDRADMIADYAVQFMDYLQKGGWR